MCRAVRRSQSPLSASAPARINLRSSALSPVYTAWHMRLVTMLLSTDFRLHRGKGRGGRLGYSTVRKRTLLCAIISSESYICVISVITRAPVRMLPRPKCSLAGSHLVLLHSKSMAGSLPHLQASSRAVLPAESRMSGSAPASSSMVRRAASALLLEGGGGRSIVPAGQCCLLSRTCRGQRRRPAAW